MFIRAFSWKNFILKSEIKFIFGINSKFEINKISFLKTIVFLGISNVGKSSLINKICFRKKISRVSKFPGSTSQINVFSLSDKLYIADCPGYGYAKKSKKEISNIKKLLIKYIQCVENNKIFNLLVDIRKGLREEDINILFLLLENQRKINLVFTKVDKVCDKEKIDKVRQAKQMLNSIIVDNKNFLYTTEISVFLTSIKNNQDLLKLCSTFVL